MLDVSIHVEDQYTFCEYNIKLFSHYQGVLKFVGTSVFGMTEHIKVYFEKQRCANISVLLQNKVEIEYVI